jgi:chromosome segregation ATPase
MVADYARIMYKDHCKALEEIDALKLLLAEVREEIKVLNSNHKKDLTELKASQRKEIAEIRTGYENQITAMHSEISNLKEENRKLRTQMDKNSSNSSKPPSSDGFGHCPKKISQTAEKRKAENLVARKVTKGTCPFFLNIPKRELICALLHADAVEGSNTKASL